MHEFWEEHSHKATVVEMMLDTEAEKIGQKEIPEIISLLPEIKGKDVLELGAGIGWEMWTSANNFAVLNITSFSRFTAFIAKQAKSVVAVDFMESFIKKNEEDNSKFKNATFLQRDVTKLEQEENRYLKLNQPSL